MPQARIDSVHLTEQRVCKGDKHRRFKDAVRTGRLVEERALGHLLPGIEVHTDEGRGKSLELVTAFRIQEIMEQLYVFQTAFDLKAEQAESVDLLLQARPHLGASGIRQQFLESLRIPACNPVGISDI